MLDHRSTPPSMMRRVWIDAHLSPALARWLTRTFGIEAAHVRELGLREADDHMIFMAARAAQAIVLTKDSDFRDLVERLGPPPGVIWITCGNTSNARLRRILADGFPTACDLLTAGNPIVEICDAQS